MWDDHPYIRQQEEKAEQRREEIKCALFLFAASMAFAGLVIMWFCGVIG